MLDKVYKSISIEEALQLLLNSSTPIKGKGLNKKGRWEKTTYLHGVYKFGTTSTDLPFRCDDGDFPGFIPNEN